MKTKLTFLLALACALLAASCAGTATGQSGTSQFEEHNFTSTIYFDPDTPEDSPRLAMTMTLLQMKASKKAAAFFNTQMYTSEDVNEYIKKVADEQREAFLASLDGRERHDWLGQESFNWEYRESVSVSNLGTKGLVTVRDVETYTGGAHGASNREYYVMDIDAQELISIDDLVTDFQGEKAREIVYDALRQFAEMEAGTPLSQGIFFDDAPELSTAFFVSQEGLGLHWNPYEIAPYVQGHIEVVIPWQQLQPVLSEDGVALLEKFGIAIPE
jgi:hypothetical protein